MLLPLLGAARLAMAEPEPAFVTDDRPSKAALAAPNRATPALRGRAVRAHPRLRELPQVSLEMPGGVTLSAERVRVDARPGGDFVWVGRLQGEPLSEVTMAMRDGVLAGVIDRPMENGNAVYAITPSAGGISVLADYEGPGEGRDGCGTLQAPGASSSKKKVSLKGLETASTSLQGLYPAATSTNPAVIDVLVVYTPATTALHGGKSGVEALILQAISSANTAYLNSGIYATLNLVHMDEVAYTETGDMSVTLTRLATQLDGHLEPAHTLRNQYGADVVVLLDQDSNYCGLSYQMIAANPAFKTSAFSVVNSGCIPSFTLTHEVGHLMGCNHDRENAVGTGTYPYSYGQKRCTTDGTGFRCLMSYSCTNASVPRVNYFSSPLVTFNGYPTGTDYDADPANSADNARTVNENAHCLVAFRAHLDLPPDVPTGLAATVPSASLVQLSWVDASFNESSFQLERSSDGIVWEQIASLSADTTSFDDTGVTAENSYFYHVRSCGTGGCSAWTSTATASVPAAILAAPTGLAVSPASAPDGAVLNWTDASTTESASEIERSVDGANWSAAASVGQNVVTWTDAGLTFGQQTWYRVRACEGANCSAWTDPASITRLAPVPAAPSNLAGSAISSSQINLTWTDNATDETAIRLERSTDGVSYSLIAQLPANSNFCADSGLAAGTTYYYRAFAINAYGASDSSGAISVTTQANTPPIAPNNLAATALSSSQIRLTWSDRSGDETGFRIERSTNGTSFTVVTTVAANTTTYTNTGLQSKKKYYYRICAVKGALSSAYTSVVSATTR